MAHESQPSVSLTLFLYFEVFCDLFLKRPMPTWNLFVLYDKEKNVNDDVIYGCISTNTS